MKKTYLIKANLVPIIFFGFILFSCQKKSNDNEIIFSKFPKEENISFTNLFEFKMGEISKIHPMDEDLIIFCNYGKVSNFFYNYSLKNGILSNGYLRCGRGPGEAIGAFCFGFNEKNLWVYDVSLKKIITFDKEQVLNQEKSLSFNEYPVKGDYGSITFQDVNTFLATVQNAPSKYKIQELDLKSQNVVNEYFEYKDIPADISLQIYKSLYEFRIFKKPTGNKVVLAYRWTDLVEIFDLEKGTYTSTKGCAGFKPEMKIVKTDGKMEAILSRATRDSFFDTSVTDKYIYLSYNGKTVEEIFKSDFNSPKYIKTVYVYDWEGNPVKKLLLDRHVSALSVSTDDKTIYAFDSQTGYIIQAKIND